MTAKVPCEILDRYRLVVIIVNIFEMLAAAGEGRWVFTVRQTIRATTCGKRERGYRPRVCILVECRDDLPTSKIVFLV